MTSHITSNKACENIVSSHHSRSTNDEELEERLAAIQETLLDSYCQSNCKDEETLSIYKLSAKS
jgi:hypothetical protein